METGNFCAYNLTKDVVLSSKVAVADAVLEPFKVLEVLIGGLGLDSESSLWLTPLSSEPQVPRLFPFDMVYLDPDHRVIQGIEVAPGADFPPYSSQVASALILPERTLSSTKTNPGDQLRVCDQSEIAGPVKRASAAPAPPSVPESPSVIKSPSVSETVPASPSPRRIVPDETIPIEVMKNSESLYEFFPSALALMPTVQAPIAASTDLPASPLQGPRIEESAAAQVAEEATLEADPQSRELESAQTPVEPAARTATPEAQAIEASGEESQRTRRRKVASVPIPADLTLQFTAAQAPIWHLSSSATPVPGKTPPPGIPKEKATEENLLEENARSKNTSSNQPQVRDQSTAPVVNHPGASSPLAPPAVAKSPNPVDKPLRVRGSVLPSPGVEAQSKESVTRQAPIAPVAISGNPAAIVRTTKPSVEEPRITRDPVPASKTPSTIQTLPEMEAEVQQLLVKERQKKKQKAESRKNVQDVTESAPSVVEPRNNTADPGRTKKPPQKAKPKIQEKTPLTARIQHWLDADQVHALAGPQDRRRSLRYQAPGLVAYYWTGGLPKAHEVADISPLGFYLRTSAPWVLHTMVRMTLQRSDKREGHPMHSLTVLAKIVRIDPDGIGHEFVFNETLNRNTRDILPDSATDVRALQKFL